MSRFSYSYQPLLILKLSHPDALDVFTHVQFTPTQETSVLLNHYKLKFKTTDLGFTISQKTSEVFKETKDANNNIIYTPKETISWLNIGQQTINLEFFCSATKRFISNTDWKDQGPKPLTPNQPLQEFSYISYVAIFNNPNTIPDMDSSSTEVEYRLDQGDFRYEPVAKLKFALEGHIPNQNAQTLIL